MSTIFLLYLPGHAGNFLSRVLTLGDDTMPQLSKSLLSYHLHNSKLNEPDRDSLYKFSQVLNDYKNWQDFHEEWCDYYQDSEYRLLRLLWKKSYRHLVYAIHPHEFIKFQYLIDRHEDKVFLGVDLDSKYDYWINENKSKLKFNFRLNERRQYEELSNDYNMPKIKLDKMLDSDEGFVEEYLDACSKLEIIPHLDRALILFKDWKSIRLC